MGQFLAFLCLIAIIVWVMVTSGFGWQFWLFFTIAMLLLLLGIVKLAAYQQERLRIDVQYTKILKKTDRYITFEIHYYNGRVVKEKVLREYKERIEILLGKLR